MEHLYRHNIIIAQHVNLSLTPVSGDLFISEEQLPNILVRRLQSCSSLDCVYTQKIFIPLNANG